MGDFVSTAKGVFENLIEKHFPAPNRDRINKILGISETSKEFKDILEEVSGKRKCVRQARLASQKTKKRYKESLSDNENDSDFEMSAHFLGSDEHSDEDEDFESENSSDFSEPS